MQILKDLWVGGNWLRQQQQKWSRQSSRHKHLSTSNIQRPSLDLKICLCLSVCPTVCVSLEQSEPSIEICNKIQHTINLQKTHYLILHRGTQALPGRWSKGKWDEWCTVSPVFIMLMEWTDRLNEKLEMWLCLEDRLGNKQQLHQQTSASEVLFKCWLKDTECKIYALKTHLDLVLLGFVPVHVIPNVSNHKGTQGIIVFMVHFPLVAYQLPPIPFDWSEREKG